MQLASIRVFKNSATILCLLHNLFFTIISSIMDPYSWHHLQNVSGFSFWFDFPICFMILSFSSLIYGLLRFQTTHHQTEWQLNLFLLHIPFYESLSNLDAHTHTAVNKHWLELSQPVLFRV